MSIAVSVKVGEGLVLGADSTTTLSSPEGVLNTYDYTRKLAQLKDYPIGIPHWGLNSLGPRNIQSLIAEFEHTLPPKEENSEYKVERVAGDIFKFFKERYDKLFKKMPKKEKPLLGMQIAGFSDGEFFPEQYVFQLPLDENLVRIREDKPDGTPNFGANWYGQNDAIVRMYLGFDSRTGEFLKAKGIQEKEIKEHFSKLEYPVSFDGMPIQDAIDFVYWLIALVIGRFRFVLGPPTCGGEIDIAVVTHSDFRWVYRKEWKPRP